jgi:hypothetical protein
LLFTWLAASWSAIILKFGSSNNLVSNIEAYSLLTLCLSFSKRSLDLFKTDKFNVDNAPLNFDWVAFLTKLFSLDKLSSKYLDI